MLFLSSTSSGLEFWWVNHTPMYENLESNVFKNIKVLGGIYQMIYYEQMYTKLLNFVDNNY